MIVGTAVGSEWFVGSGVGVGRGVGNGDGNGSMTVKLTTESASEQLSHDAQYPRSEVVVSSSKAVYPNAGDDAAVRFVPSYLISQDISPG